MDFPKLHHDILASYKHKHGFSNSSGMPFIVLHKLRYIRVSTIRSFITINHNRISNQPCACTASHPLSGCATIKNNCQLVKRVVTLLSIIVERIPARTVTFKSVILKRQITKLGAFFYKSGLPISPTSCP